MCEEATRSRVLVVGATGRLGGCLVRASLAAGHPTFALVRPHHLAVPDSAPLTSLAGATVVKGSLEDYPSLLEAVRQVDVVICAVPTKQALEQKLLIRAIKDAGCVKRFIPAEYGLDPTKVQICGMDHGFYEKKIEIRHLIESECIPHTYICCNFLMRYLLPSLVQPGLDAPPRDEVKIFGDGNTRGLCILLLSFSPVCCLVPEKKKRGVFVEETDVAKFTICTIDDPRTLNNTLYLRPSGNVYSMNELVDLWEKKINKFLNKIYITEEQLLKNIEDAPLPLKMDLIFIYSTFIKGDQTYFEIDSRKEGTQLYPHFLLLSSLWPSNCGCWKNTILLFQREAQDTIDILVMILPQSTRVAMNLRTQKLSGTKALGMMHRTPPRFTEQVHQNSSHSGGKNELRKKSNRTPPRFRPSMESFSRSSIKEKFSQNRSISTPKLRPHEKEHPPRAPAFLGTNLISKQGEMDSADNIKEDSHAENCSQEINELIANGKWPNSRYNEYACTSTESIPTGDIFFSRDCRAPIQRTPTKHNNDKSLTSETARAENYGTEANSNNLAQTPKSISAQTGLSRTIRNSNYGTSRHTQINSGATLSSQFNSGRYSGDSGKFSDFTGKLVGGVMKFTSNMQKAQNDSWLPCVTGKTCRKPKSPNSKTTDESESSFIQKALVVENIRLFWADKYRPRTLGGFTCHREQIEQLKQLVSTEFCPHIIFKGPPGSGKSSLCRAVVTEIFGDSSLNVSHYLKSCSGQGSTSMPVLVPLSSSDHHMELNLRYYSKNAGYVLMDLANEITNKKKTTDPSVRKKFKVIVLYDVDKVSESNQRLIKWMIDSSSDTHKILMTCQDESHILDSMKSRCKLICIGVPNTREIVDILTYISKKESFDLPSSFAATIASQSRQNMREAILALEACKANNYPFIDGQAIPLGWENVLQEIAAEILDDPSPKRLFLVRGKLQKLLVEFVPPKLILQKLAELFLKGIQSSIKREVYYWHAYYDKRLPVGASALLKLEEFVAKFMSIHRKTLPVRSTRPV
uniref:NmrA-like domain-containing protein n=1 Tax=Oryza glumipatula TaxID=40148 RepID=A0A0D9YX30_9ORYZ